ncbi:MAG: acyltransferase [Betaproteobacteria bacterium]|nr:acyltransferase [Betaproteobacteria bacterium]
MVSGILFFILLILLLKSAFVFCSYIVSIIYFRYVKNKIAPTSQVNENDGLFKEKARQLLGRYANGFVFYSLLKTGKIPFHTIRNFIYRHFYKANIEKNVIIYSEAEIRSPNKLTIGKGSIIGHYSVLDARNFIEIGENVNFSHGVWLWTEQHNHNDPDFGCESAKEKKITIYDRVWLGPRVIVLPGCTIGEGAVVGAGSVVTKDIEPFSINAGIPARKIGERNRNINYVFKDQPVPFI